MYVSKYVCMYVCMYGCMDGWMDGWMEGWIEAFKYHQKISSKKRNANVLSIKSIAQCTNVHLCTVKYIF